jgi:hypothetical protein
MRRSPVLHAVATAVRGLPRCVAWDGCAVSEPRASARRRAPRAFLTVTAVVAFSVPPGIQAAGLWIQGVHRGMPVPAHVRLDARLWDQTAVVVTTTAAWQKIPVKATVDGVRRDPALWRRMFFDDFDRLPAPLRTEALDTMWLRYGHLVRAPSHWDRMTPRDWDLVPQPVRAMVFIEMVRYWSGYYQTGVSYGLPRGTVTNTMAAILMTESGFVHRASYVNSGGNRDVGLAQTSDWTRAAVARLHQAGTIDFAPAGEADYYDPWQATRVLVLWFGVMLDETRGDLDAAIRAYNRGAPLARAGAGEAYLTAVVDRRRRYLRDETGSATWAFLRAKVRELEARPDAEP